MTSRFEKHGEIGLIWIDNPPVNAISVAVRTALIDGVAELLADTNLKAGIILCAGRTFMAGADITEFGKPPLSPVLPEVLSRIELSSKPLIAALHGTALGGGLEIALACHYRISLPSAKVGLPEVKLGLIPGAGGTQRLPRLIGVEEALAMIISGDVMPAKKAATLGILDLLVDGELDDAALHFTKGLIAGGAKPIRVRDLKIDNARYTPEYFDQIRRNVTKDKRGLYAPQRVVDAVQAAVTLRFDDGLKRERELFLDCMAQPQSKALRHIFFAERKTSSIQGLGRLKQMREVERVAVVGAGTMGGGIAVSFLNAGLPVTLLESRGDALDRGIALIRRNYEGAVAKGRLTAEQVEERLTLLKPSLSYEDFHNADLIIEAVFETMTVKREVFTRIDAIAKPGAILASNTSYLSIHEIAQATSRPADVIGMHFFSPANVMRLMEIVRADSTGETTLATVMEVAKRIGKIGVVCGDRYGFIGNRMLQAYLYQGLLMLLEGALPEQIDGALRHFGMPMGLFQMSDLAGLDIGYKSRKDRDPSSFDARVYRSADRLVELGRLGQKTQAGYYDYAAGDRNPKPSPEVRQILQKASAEQGFSRRSFEDDEIVQRCMLSLMNTGCEVLREGVAARASDIDIVYLNGYGFPAYRGGPMYWAEHEFGLASALDQLREFERTQQSPFMRVSPLLVQLVREGKGFATE